MSVVVGDVTELSARNLREATRTKAGLMAAAGPC